MSGWVENGIGYIPLTRGQVALVDPEDIPWLSQWKWRSQSTSEGRFYAVRWEESEGKRKLCIMHRFILSVGDDQVVDHINHDTLDDRRGNIRVCKTAENLMNKRRYINNKSGFKGVCLIPESGRYRAAIRVGGKKINLGNYPTPEKAYDAYLSAANTYHGEYACAG